jgi:hypothetical protein
MCVEILESGYVLTIQKYFDIRSQLALIVANAVLEPVVLSVDIPNDFLNR